MTNYIYKVATGSLAVFCMLSMASCSDKEEMPAAGGDGSEMSVSLKGLLTSSAGTSTNQEAISVFQFGNDRLFSKSEFKTYDPEAINLIKGTTKTLYCVSGLELEATEETVPAEFALSTISNAEGDNSAPLFMSGWAAIEPTQMNCEINMTRGVARIDLDARDADMEIKSITVDNAPSVSYVFVGDKGVLEAETTVYTHEYTTAPDGIENGVFLLFESAKAVDVTVHGSVDGMEIDVPATLESVERNKVYTLRVYDKNASVKAGFTVADWVDGGVIPGSTDIKNGLRIDLSTSVFPEDVKVDAANNIIEVPGTGVKDMKIAFNSEVRVDIDTIIYSGERVEIDSVESKHVKILAEKAYSVDNGIITKFDVNINPQLKGRPDYEIRMHVKKMTTQTSYDYVTIRVAQSPIQIPTVELAGITWMAFNCTTPELDDQIYVDEGKTVEDMYIEDWVNCVGGLFQFGRQYKYIPYQAYNPSNDLGEQKQDIPWVHDTHMPCPDGYHVPTVNELLQLFPAGTQLNTPCSYVAGNGETIDVEIVRLPGDVVTPTNVNGVCRYLKLTSQITGNCLILPLAGYKGDKSTAASSNFGRDAVYWGNDNVGCPGGHARAMRMLFNWGANCDPNIFQFQMEAFAYVRAVKNN